MFPRNKMYADFRKYPSVEKSVADHSAYLLGAKKGSDAPAKNPDTVTTFPAAPFTVKVIIHDLNYRSKPLMNGKVNGQTGKGVFTIVEVRDGWGRLKSGAGWIWLCNPSYCTSGNAR